MRRRTIPAKPVKPVPSNSSVAGSGTGAVILACTDVTPLFVAGGTRGSGLLVRLYVIPLIVAELTENVTSPVLEFC